MGPTYAELPSHPPASPEHETCLVCDKGEDTTKEGNDLLECEKCEEPWHLQCLDPPLDSVPEGEWHCPRCLDLVLGYSKASSGKSNEKSKKESKKRGPEEEEEEDNGTLNGKKANVKKAKGKGKGGK